MRENGSRRISVHEVNSNPAPSPKGMDRRLMIKQRLGEIPGNGVRPRLEAFISGQSGWYVFAPMVAPGISGTFQFPVRGKDLKRDWKRKLV